MMSTVHNQVLLTVSRAAAHHPAWADYAAYCLTREQGLRRDAFRQLTTFLAKTERWTLDQQIEFVSFLFPFFETLEAADYGPLPQPLSERLVKPTLLDWCAREQKDSRPFRWYGRYYRDRNFLLRALDLNPTDDIARETLLGWWLSSLYYSIHELPTGYLGSPTDDLALGDLVREHITHLASDERRSYWTRKSEENLELVRTYIQWQESGHPNLAQWCAEHGKRASYAQGSTYYYQK